jgi:SPP1 family predicted phage head-tail adaptor
MNAGTLDRRLTLLQWETSLDSIGGVIDSWAFYRYSWGRWLPTTGREFIAAQTRIAETAGVLRMRYRTDLPSTWRVICEGQTYEVAAPVQSVGRKDAIDVILKLVPETENLSPASNIWTFNLVEGTSEVDVRFPIPFASIPQGLYVQLIVPNGGETFTLTSSAITADSFHLDFSAVVPGAGYKVSVQAFQNRMTYTEDLTEGQSTMDFTFSPAFPRAPRGLKVTLQPPYPDGYEFTTALEVNTLTANGFTLDLGAITPGPGYKVLIQASL